MVEVVGVYISGSGRGGGVVSSWGRVGYLILSKGVWFKLGGWGF